MFADAEASTAFQEGAKSINHSDCILALSVTESFNKRGAGGRPGLLGISGPMWVKSDSQIGGRHTVVGTIKSRKPGGRGIGRRQL